MVSPTAGEAHHWLRALFNDSPMAIGFSRDGTMLDANPAYLATFGYGRVEEVRGRSLLEQIAPSHREDIVSKIARRAHGQFVDTSYLSRGLRRDGSEFPFEITTCRVAVPDGPLTIAFIRDVSERERTQAELTAALEMFRTLSSAALEGVYVHEAGKIILVNQAGAAMVGGQPEQLVGRSVLELCTPETRATAKASIEAGSSVAFEVVAQGLDGRQLPIEIRPRLLQHQGRSTRIAIVRDLSERKKEEAARAILDERLRRADKLESLGTLAAGVAHDFNNILTIIMAEVALARVAKETGRPLGDNLLAIDQAAERAAELCRQMLAYGGRAHIDQQRIDLSALIADMSVMVESAVAKRASLRWQLEPGLRPVLGDSTQLRQVLLNLVLNACEATSAPTSEISIATGALHLASPAPGRTASGDELGAGDYVWLEVTDAGAGMDATTAARMFDPFFTTKALGRGLGMASVIGIIRGHRGAIDVESELGRGTRIRVWLPAAAAAAADGDRPAALPKAGLTARGTGLLLVVEDEPGIRRATGALLRSYGFEVLLAADGAEGVELFAAHAGRIRAVLMDLAMPGMDGVAASAEIRRQAPGVPILLLTGNVSVRPDALSKSGANELMEKPYLPAHLLAALLRLTGAR